MQHLSTRKEVYILAHNTEATTSALVRATVARSAKSFWKGKRWARFLRPDLLTSLDLTSASTSVVTVGKACLECRLAFGSYKGANVYLSRSCAIL